MIKRDPNIPVYFFNPEQRKVLEGRYSPAPGANTTLVITEDGEQYFQPSRLMIINHRFTNDRKQAKKDGLEFFKAEVANHRRQLKTLYRDMFKLKWGIK